MVCLCVLKPCMQLMYERSVALFPLTAELWLRYVWRLMARWHVYVLVHGSWGRVRLIRALIVRGLQS